MLKRNGVTGFALIAILFGLSSCASMEWCVEGQCFDTADDVLAYNRSLTHEVFEQIQPLETPIAKTAVITIPPIEEHERTNPRGPSWKEEWVRDTARISDSDFVFLAELIQHRNIFASTRVVRVETGTDFDEEPDGYVVRLNYDDTVVYMRAAGESDLVPLDLNRQQLFGMTYVDRHRYILEVIEAFVTAHPPRT